MIDLKELPDNEALPPVHQWQPDFCGDMDMLIKANGDWIHEGGKIHRPAMVKMFSRILWQEAGEHFLVTPVEKVRIQVEDAPFLVTQWRRIETTAGWAYEFTTATEDVLVLGENTDLWLADFQGEQRPYLSMRYGMKALIGRSVFYQLTECLEPVTVGEESGLGLISAGKSYLLMQDE
ncbi:DUF1285 domain-containing protein [Marinomonas aquiplantarum]|uniref:DUF1285 domain-containing protein n=1 Tax=Marinomonas aquiplantarum TaxID=491951 RepID=A0A366D165_9GAMM|nr:DUF1285 domain-containing protein [Marinomonas aquiplantarum]RBO83812.1 hypothetical protein DFP76_10386 [Marinomonas aquiplantarum]